MHLYINLLCCSLCRTRSRQDIVFCCWNTSRALLHIVGRGVSLDYDSFMIVAIVLTCYVSIVLLQLVGLHPLVATLLIDMNFMVIWTDGNFCRKETNKREVNMVDLKVSEPVRPVPVWTTSLLSLTGLRQQSRQHWHSFVFTWNKLLTSLIVLN